MKFVFSALLLAVILSAEEQPNKPQTLKEVLLEQLHTTHDKADWFVPLHVAIAGLKPAQVTMTDNHGNHSIGQLAYHLLFWDTRALQEFNGEKPPKFSGNNDETFDKFDSLKWPETVEKLDAVMKAWEKAVADADEAKLKANASLIAHIGTHNAYHIGQIIYVRKLQGTWDASNGVK